MQMMLPTEQPQKARIFSYSTVVALSGGGWSWFAASVGPKIARFLQKLTWLNLLHNLLSILELLTSIKPNTTKNKRNSPSADNNTVIRVCIFWGYIPFKTADIISKPSLECWNVDSPNALRCNPQTLRNTRVFLEASGNASVDFPPRPQHNTRRNAIGWLNTRDFWNTMPMKSRRPHSNHEGINH